MSITILGKEYDINLQTLDLRNNQLSSLPAEIDKLVNLKVLNLLLKKCVLLFVTMIIVK